MAIISLIVFTKGFAKYGSKVKATTMAQWMGNRYNSNSYVFFGVIALLLITFIVLMLD
jgi:sodium/pantothenate symporter